MNNYKLDAVDLRKTCSPEIFKFNNTSEIPPLEGVVGQERARKALEFGLKMKSDGYNIFVTGISGTGKTSSVEQGVRKIAKTNPIPDDWCYVYNFSNPDNPSALRLPQGQAAVFKKDMEELVHELENELQKTFESHIYEEHRNQILKNLQKNRNELFEDLEKMSKASGFDLKKTPSGIAFIPTIEGKPIEESEAENLTEKTKEDIRNRQEILHEKLNEILRVLRKQEKAAQRELADLERETAQYTIDPRTSELKEKYNNIPDIIKYLDEVEKDMILNIEEFKENKETEVLPGIKMPSKPSSLYKYSVNAFIDNSDAQGAPVIKETNPTAYNLTGRIEYKPQYGAMTTDFTMLKAGAMQKANGGYLIIQILDIFKNYFAWETLKRALQNKEAVIEDLNEQFRLINTPTLKPEPIPLNLKVILIGNPMFYYLLYTYDEDLKKLFKIKADFSTVMDKQEQGLKDYSAFIAKICTEEGLKHLTAEAVCRIVEFGSRIAEHQNKLTTRFIEIADIIREANFWAYDEETEFVEKQHIVRALEEKIFRSNLIEERIGELIREETIMVDTEGAVTGQINGLSVMTLGDYSFGKPSRITATIYTGRSGILNIEREVKLSGEIHNKGFLILSGYLGEQYGSTRPLIFQANICFEQVYDEIDGDSASSTELYALISGLSGIPIEQGIAVTGSVNQKGEVQPVGGINQKIEGFYYTCKSKKLTGRQGVIIPEKNIKHLMLNDEIIEAVDKGNFSIWAVKTIDEGIEILTGKEAGKKNKDGSYKNGSINDLVSKKLESLAKNYLEYQEKNIPKPKKRKRRKG